MIAGAGDSNLYFIVGMQGIEPCLTAPKAVVLPVYDIPLLMVGAARAE